MDCARRTGVLALMVCAVVFVLGGCRTHHAGHFFQDDAFLESQMFNVASVPREEEESLRTLRDAGAKLVLFVLRPSGAECVESLPADRAYWSEDIAAFYLLDPKAGGGEPQLLYFDPHSMKATSLESACVPGGGMLALDDGHWGVFRSVPSGQGQALDKKCMDVFQFPFHRDSQGCPVFEPPRRYTDSPGAKVFPMVCGGRDGKLLFLERISRDEHRLWISDAATPTAGPVWAEQPFDVQFPRVLPDGRVFLAANPDGMYQFYEFDPACAGEPDRGLVRAALPLVPRAEDPRFVVAARPEGGRIMPVLFERPALYDLEALCSEVIAHNPHVNEKQAVYAGALMKESMAGLNSWPVLNLGGEFSTLVSVLASQALPTAGDYVLGGLSRGFLSMVQPLLDFKHDWAVSQAGKWRADMERDRLDNEINERLAEMSELYHEAQYLTKLIPVKEQLIEVAVRRHDIYKQLEATKESLPVQTLAVSQVETGLRSELEFNRQRLVFVKNRLKEVAGLPQDLPLELTVESFHFEEYEPEPLGEMRQVALLNHPGLRAINSAIGEAFYFREYGAEIRPSAQITAGYDVSRNTVNRVVEQQIPNTNLTQEVYNSGKRTEETFTGGLTLRYPLASKKAGRLDDAYWTDYIHGLQAQRDAEERRIGTAMEEAYMDFRAAQMDYRAKRASAAYFAEKLRVARLHRAIAPPETPITVMETISRPGAMDEMLQTHPLAHLTAQFEYIESIAKIRKVEMDCGLRYAKLWRERGLAVRFAKEGLAWKDPEYSRGRPSLWLWRTKDVLAGNSAINEWIQRFREFHIRRVYAYLYSDSLLLNDPPTRERMSLFINRCAEAGIEVWGLIGEPEWLVDTDQKAVGRALERILKYNVGFGPYEPRLAGVKIDLEPHALPGWDTDPQVRSRLNAGYIELLQTARQALNGALPLWVDCPVKYFRDDSAPLLESIRGIADGMTAMCYFPDPERLKSEALAIVARAGKPIEIGMELSPKAPSDARLKTMSREAFDAFCRDLVAAANGNESFQGLAIHDESSLAAFSTVVETAKQELPPPPVSVPAQTAEPVKEAETVPSGPPPDAKGGAAPETDIPYEYHVVQKGENLFRLAVNLGMTEAALARLNDRVAGAVVIQGEKLKVPKKQPGGEAAKEAVVDAANAPAPPLPPAEEVTKEAPTMPAAVPAPVPADEAVTPAPSEPPPNVKGVPAPENDIPYEYHVVQKGENLFRLAVNLGMTEAALARLNDRAEGAVVILGEKLKVPKKQPGGEAAKDAVVDAANAPAPPLPPAEEVKQEVPTMPAAAQAPVSPVEAAPSAPSEPPPDVKKVPAPEIDIPYEYHVVQEGESLYRIAVNLGMTEAALARLNDRAEGAVVILGEKLKVPKKQPGDEAAEKAAVDAANAPAPSSPPVEEVKQEAPTMPATAQAPVSSVEAAPSAPSEPPPDVKKVPAPENDIPYEYHVVQKGENLFRLAVNLGMTEAALARLNGRKEGAMVMLGEKLKVPKRRKASEPAKGAAVVGEIISDPPADPAMEVKQAVPETPEAAMTPAPATPAPPPLPEPAPVPSPAPAPEPPPSTRTSARTGTPSTRTGGNTSTRTGGNTSTSSSRNTRASTGTGASVRISCRSAGRKPVQSGGRLRNDNGRIDAVERPERPGFGQGGHEIQGAQEETVTALKRGNSKRLGF